MAAASQNAAPAAAGEDVCAICYVGGREEQVDMPCCGSTNSTTFYCRRCIEIICESAPGKVGMCPIGCGFITIDPAGIVRRVEVRSAVCRLCQQTREMTDTSGLCAACRIGVTNALLYECDRCHRVQRIPHPMYRYQHDGVHAFGDVTWACHVGCGDYTHWRVVPEDAERVPAHDAPASWGQREVWLAAVRAQRLRELNSGGAAARDADAPGPDCIIT
mmetsp:Transcript_19650/g.50776  ORF Transcript_19650/g.50776 Transcript_19650/m.50776 type:complete len:218 (+) Transcript_19650:30-683(+)